MRILGLAALWMAATGPLCAATPLIDGGQSEYAIVVAPDAVPAEKTAARELRDYLHKMTGAVLPVLETNDPAGKAIYVGQGPRVAARLGGFDFARLGYDGVLLRRVGDDLVLAGARPRGALYAVYDFLESLGVRRWTHRDTVVPATPTVELADWDYEYAPPFRSRDRIGGAGGVYGAWLRVNGHWDGVPESHGGVDRIIGWCHTFDKMIPPGEYLKTHPEYFALVDGRRDRWNVNEGSPQLCLSNPDVRRIVREKTLEWLRADPNPRMVSVSINDSWGSSRDNYCRCGACAAVDAAGGGSPAASVLSLVNEVAEAVAGEFPEVLVETIVYHYVQKPTSVIPRDNVVPRYCTWMDYLYPWDSPRNAAARDQFLAWRRISKQMMVWNYNENFANFLHPRPGFENYAADTRFMADHGVIGVLQHGYGRGIVGDLAPLQTYVLAKLMWNPRLDIDALTDEFLVGYYGAAAPMIREYMAARHDAYVRCGKAVAGENAESAKNLPMDELLALKAIFDRGVAAAGGDATAALRVKTAALVVDLPILYADVARIENAGTPAGKALRAKIDLAALADAADATYRALDIKEFYRESTEATVDRYIAAARRLVTGDWGVTPAVCAGLPAGSWRQILPAELYNWAGETTTDAEGQPVVAATALKDGASIQWHWRPAEQVEGRWKVLLEIRSETSAPPDHNALVVGYIGENGFTKQVKFRDIAKPGYVFLDCGAHDLANVGRLVVNHINRNQKLYLRKIILIRAD